MSHAAAPDTPPIPPSSARADTSSGAWLQLVGLSKAFGATPVFEGIDAEIAQGEFVTLLGPSGCGKSTLLRTIAGLTPLDAGAIRVGGDDIAALPPQRRGVGMVFQHYALFPNMSVADNVAFGLRMARAPADERRRRVADTLALVELEDQAQKRPSQLSGGQRQRVALARSLIVRPRILLLDEPLSALDARIRQHLREQLRHIQRQLGLTTLFVTHDQEEALMLSDRILLMERGRMLQQDQAEALYNHPASAAVARFVGHWNWLNAHLAERLLGFPPEGERVALRPEALYLVASDDSASTAAAALPPHHGPGCPGTIMQRRLLGNVVRYRVACAEGELHVDVLNRSARYLLEENSRVRVYADIDEVRAL